MDAPILLLHRASQEMSHRLRWKHVVAVIDQQKKTFRAWGVKMPLRSLDLCVRLLQYIGLKSPLDRIQELASTLNGNVSEIEQGLRLLWRWNKTPSHP